MKLRARGSKSRLRTISTGWHKGEHYVVRIAVTGGPSGGKGEAIELITRRLTDNGLACTRCPARICCCLTVASQSHRRPKLCGQVALWRMVLELQLQLERTWAKIAAGRHSLCGTVSQGHVSATTSRRKLAATAHRVGDR